MKNLTTGHPESKATRGATRGIFNLVILSFVVFFISCAQTPKRAAQPTPSTIEDTSHSYNTEEVWQAIYQLTIEFPVHDFSKEEGTLESEWIQDEKKLSQYRFFVSLNSDEMDFQKIPFFVDIENQSRKNKRSPWRTSQPSVDKEEKIKNHIYEHLKKNRSA